MLCLYYISSRRCARCDARRPPARAGSEEDRDDLSGQTKTQTSELSLLISLSLSLSLSIYIYMYTYIITILIVIILIITSKYY